MLLCALPELIYPQLMTSSTPYGLQLLLTQAFYQSIFILLQSPLIDLNRLSVSGDPNKLKPVLTLSVFITASLLLLSVIEVNQLLPSSETSRLLVDRPQRSPAPNPTLLPVHLCLT